MPVGADGQARAFVGLRVRFQCRACGHMAPIDRLDESRSIHCVRCGIDQAFDGRAWGRLLARAHAIADLGGSREGRHPHARIAIDSPYAGVGVSFAALEQQDHGEVGALRQLVEARLFPGHPLCVRCGLPPEVRPVIGGVLHVACVCGAEDTYELPAQVRPRGVLGAMAPAHRAKVAPAAIESGAAFQCPTCGGPLPVDGRARIVTCAFCHVASRLPDGAFRALVDVEPETIWVLFDGPSAERKSLEQDGDIPIETPPPLPPGATRQLTSRLWAFGLPSAALLIASLLATAAWWASGRALAFGLGLP